LGVGDGDRSQVIEGAGGVSAVAEVGIAVGLTSKRRDR
jgi:hypothetical protein